MRLFIAIEILPEVEKYLIELQTQLAGAKLTLAKHIHLTLKFLGEVSPQNAEKVEERLKQIKFNKFKATLGSIGFFPSEKHARVVWVGVEPQKVICELQKKIDDSLEGLFPKEKDFQPHLTLARVKEINNKSQFEKIKDIKVKTIEFSATEFKLVESKLSPKGPEYRDVKVYALQ